MQPDEDEEGALGMENIQRHAAVSRDGRRTAGCHGHVEDLANKHLEIVRWQEEPTYTDPLLQRLSRAL